MDILAEIVAKKKSRLAAAKRNEPLAELRARASEVRFKSAPHHLRRALARDEGLNIIAEIKRASPSKGSIRSDVDPGKLARAYAAGGAVAISVLTEEDYFRGSLNDLQQVRQAVSLPVLQKDFIFDEYQLYQAAAAGADAILLIVAMLEDDLLADLRQIAEEELGMDALIEVHTGAEMKRAADCRAKIIGVNNRDLRTFKVSLETSTQFAPLAPRDALLISESGLGAADEIRRLRSLGFRGFLIGEHLMRADDPKRALHGLISDAK